MRKLPARFICYVLLLFLIIQKPLSHADELLPEAVEDDIRVVSFNIRNGKAEDGINHWDNRKDRVVEMMQSLNTDLFALQEVYPFQRDYLLEALPGFDSVGEGRDGEDSEAVNIFVSKARFNILDSGTFWLSNTPDEMSLTWYWWAYLYRICTWVYLEDKNSGESFYLYNTHYDHFSSTARENSSKLILDKIAQRAEEKPYILIGDFNAVSQEKPIQLLLNDPETVLIDSFEAYEGSDKSVGTFNGFQADNSKRIDFIFTSPQIRVKRMDIHQDKLDGFYPSDHFPVSADFSLPVR